MDKATQGTPGNNAQVLPVSVTVDVGTNFGDQRVVLTGWVDIRAGELRLEDGNEVVDVQLAQVHLTGVSQLGLITVSTRNDGTHVSKGEIRSLQPGAQFPAASFFDLYVDISAPDSPAGALLLYNDDALRLVPWKNGHKGSLTAWPPLGVQYRKGDQGVTCVPLLDQTGIAVRLGVCVRDLTLDIAPWLPTFSVGRNGPSRLHPADLLGLTPADTGVSGQAPFVRIPCSSLGLTVAGCDGSSGRQDNVDALSYGKDMAKQGPRQVFFSVGPGAHGAPGTAVEQQYNCPPSHPGLAPEAESDVFSSALDGTNQIVFDGNGPIGSCTSAFPLGLIEAPTARDNVDAVDLHDASTVDPDGDGVPEQPVYFSLDADSPSLIRFGFSAADILVTVDGRSPTIFASAAQLGLRPGDDIDALCLRENGDGIYDAGDVVYFALTPRSPSLAAVGAGPGDILAPESPPVVVARGPSLGLAGTDALDALSCETVLSPSGAIGDVNCDGVVDEIDAQFVLQYEAGLIAVLPCLNSGDVNGDGAVNSIDALLILQLNVGLIGRLPR